MKAKWKVRYEWCGYSGSIVDGASSICVTSTRGVRFKTKGHCRRAIKRVAKQYGITLKKTQG